MRRSCQQLGKVKNLRSLLRCRNPVIGLYQPNFCWTWAFKITKTCCWCMNYCQWSAALLETCLFSSKTMHQHIVLATHSRSCDVSPLCVAVFWGMRSSVSILIQAMDDLHQQFVETCECQHRVAWCNRWLEKKHQKGVSTQTMVTFNSPRILLIWNSSCNAT